MRLSLLPIQILIIVLLFSVLIGCESLHYYGQAIHGQAAIITKRRPISRLLTHTDTPETIKVKLRQVLDLRSFAAEKLSLPVKNNYLTYVALDRPYVVWTVFAAPEFSFSPKTWRYPFVGRTAYRGYFSENTARRYAEKLEQEGLDVHIGHVSAYSTLGWFDDPVLSTIINRSEAGLARIIFHELAHQVLYVDDDTVFNESFATAVEEAGIRLWAAATNHGRAYEAYRISRQRQAAFTKLVMTYRDQLKLIYEEKQPVANKRRRKAETIASMRAQYRKLKQQWQGYNGYDTWFNTPINNAKFNTVATYFELVPAFMALYGEKNGNLEDFYHICKQLSQKPKEARRQAIRKYLPAREQPLTSMPTK